MKTRSATATLGGPGSSRTLAAKCPAGTKALGGGYRTTAPNIPGGGPIPFTYESRRSGKRRWRVSVYQYHSSTGGGEMTAFVYCARFAGRIRTRFATTSISPTASRPEAANARCPRGTRAVSGGFQASPPTEPGVGTAIFISKFRRLGQRAWTAAGFSFPSGSGTLITSVSCAKLRLASRAAPGTISLDETFLSAPCQPPAHVVSGGFGTSPVLGGPGTTFVLVYESAAFGPAWRLSAVQVPGGSTPVTSLAYCG